jgi:hypothetical protein
MTPKRTKRVEWIVAKKLPIDLGQYVSFKTRDYAEACFSGLLKTTEAFLIRRTIIDEDVTPRGRKTK